MQFRKMRVTGEAADKERYISALTQAQQEYQVAHSCFDEAVEPEVIDEAIFLMAAARKKYAYFLKKVRGSCETTSTLRHTRDARREESR